MNKVVVNGVDCSPGVVAELRSRLAAAESREERLAEALREIVSEGQHGEYCHYRNEILTMGGKTECLSDCPIYVARAALAEHRDAKGKEAGR